MNSTLKRKSQLIHKKHQFLPDEHSWDHHAAFILALYGPAINSAAFKKMAARCSQAMLAHALLDSNAFAMAFSICGFSAR
jgi:hypothetical protein